MAHKLKAVLQHCVLVLMLQSRPVLPAPLFADYHAELCRTTHLVNLLRREAKEALDNYINFHKIKDGSVPDNVPDPTVSGMGVPEQLRDIYMKNGLFRLHVAKVVEYQKKTWGDAELLTWSLEQVQRRLSNSGDKIKALLGLIKPGSSLATAAPPQLSHRDDFAKKEYGWAVLVRLREWLEQVLKVLEKAKVQKCVL